MSKELTIDEKKAKFEKDLIYSFSQWQNLYENGTCDPTWSDGIALNGLRNHIIFYKGKLEEIEYYPEAYYRETPPEVDRNYMAKAEDIRFDAQLSLDIYNEDDNYHFLLQNKDSISKKEADKICLPAVLGYVTGLKLAIEKDDLITMRRHRNPETYQNAFRDCKERLKKLVFLPKAEKLGQLSIFDFI